jgi:esterase FrsA
MNDVDELKRFVIVHARAQNITRCAQVLESIQNDDNERTGSWAREWMRSAESLERNGKLLEASQHYTMARFPYVDGSARQRALERGVASFDRWRREHSDIQPLEVNLPDGRFRCWTAGLSTTRRRPVMLIMGGIVSTKEQWAPVLRQADRLGVAGVVTEMPGTGENTLPYDAESWRMLPALFDSIADRADVANTYALTLSFSGHMALRCAVDDARIRGIVTSGVPVSRFFTDTAWHRSLPQITVDTLAHLTGKGQGEVTDRIRHWALSPEQLRALDIPVHCMVSRRDEVISREDVRQLACHVSRTSFLEQDDVHGSPHHIVESRLWTVRSLLFMRRRGLLLRAAISTVLCGFRLYHQVVSVVARSQADRFRSRKEAH